MTRRRRRVLAAIGCAASLAVTVTSCGSKNTDETVSTAVVPEATTTTTGAATTQPAVTSAPTTKAPPATEAPTTTTEPESSSLQVGENHVAGVTFGTPAEAAKTALDQHFGSPDEDSDWVEYIATEELSDPEAGEPGKFYADDDNLSDSWGYRMFRKTCWGSLCVIYGGDDSGSATLRGWELASIGPNAGDPGNPDVELEDTGIRLGSTWQELQNAYPGVVAGSAEGFSFAVDERPWPGIFDGVAEWRLSGRADGNTPTVAPPDSQVIRLSAGEGPVPGCC